MFGETRTRRAAGKPKQNTRSPQGGGKDPKQCPGDAQGHGREIRGDQATEGSRVSANHLNDPQTASAKSMCSLLDGARTAAE
jgi:hypothetical protein